jgi:ABC-type Fe3+-hydroxamate transport system substrate-binding protein
MRLLIALVLSSVALPAAPQRIVSAAPAITETLFVLGLGDRVVGVTTHCRFPEEARKKPKIGGYLRPSLETIVALRPDLVIAERAPSNLVTQLAGLKISVVEVDFKTLPDILASFQKIADAAGVPERGLALRNSITRQMDQIRVHVKGHECVKMMFVVGRTSGTLTGIIVVGGNSYLSELMGIAGGVNAFADSTAAYPKVTLEEVLARDPDVILDRADMGDQGAATEAQKRAVINLWRTYPMLKAVKRDRVVFGISDIFFVPGPRIIDAAQAFAKILHPEVKW